MRICVVLASMLIVSGCNLLPCDIENARYQVTGTCR